jgi:hypothetical protein
MTRKQALNRIVELADELNMLQQKYLTDDILARRRMLEIIASEAEEVLEEQYGIES